MAEILSHSLRLTAVSQDRVFKRVRIPVVPTPSARADAPQGRCAHAGGGDIERRLHLPVRSPEVLFDRNDDAVASAHIMQKEITEWMELFSAKRVRHGECALIDGCPGRSRYECPNVAGCTPDLIEQDRPLLCAGRARQLRISRRPLRCWPKPSEGIDL